MASSVPDYVASAKPVPSANRIPWYKSTAQTYAGIMLWFVFWDSLPVGNGTPGGSLAQGLPYALLGLVVAALICHFFYYLVPGLLGQKSGLPLYIVGTSTYGVTGGFLMPGFLMGVLQFGWLGVNAFASATLLCLPFGHGVGSPTHIAVSAVWAIAAAFMGLKGIKYVARVATFFPVIPLTVLVVLFVLTVGGIVKFKPQDSINAAKVEARVAVEKAAEKAPPAEKAAAIPSELGKWAVVALLMTTIIGFFATAGAAGADFGMNNRDTRDVQLGGLVGIAGSTIFAGGLSLLIVAGAHGMGYGPLSEMKTTNLMSPIMAAHFGEAGPKVAAVFMYLLAIAAFPPACFSSFIAANSFKTTLPKVNPFISVGLGTLVSIILAATGWAGQVVEVFVVIGASFGPICGAMMADYLLAGRKWAGPRAGFNPAGWISWAVGFVVGAADLLVKYAGILAERVPALSALQPSQHLKEIVQGIPVPPLSAMVVGFLLYFILAVLGLQTRKLEMPAPEQQTA